MGAFSQWLLPFSTEKVSASSQDIQQHKNPGIIVTDLFQQQKLEEQKAQTINQKAREERKRRRRAVLSISSIAISVLSIASFVFLQSLPQIRFFTNGDDYKSRVTSISWSPKNELVASTTQDGGVRIWDVTRGITSLIYYPGLNQNMYNPLTGADNNISWSPNGKDIAFGSNDNKIRVIDSSNLQNPILTYFSAKNSDIVNTVDWSPSGEYIAFGGEDARVYVQKLSNGQTIATYSNGAPISALAWSRDGKFIAAGGSDGEVHVWNPTTGKNIFNTPKYSGGVTSLAWSPTSPSLFASTSSDSQVDVWNITKGYSENPLVAYTKHAGSVNGVAWSPDGNEIASGDDEGTLHVWDATTGNDISIYQDYLHTMFNNTYVVISAIAWSSDGKSIAFGHNEYDKNDGYSSYYTVKVVKFCKSWCYNF